MSDAVRERVEATNEQIVEAWKRLVNKGREQARGQAETVTMAMVKACTHALTNPGCEVRVTAETVERAAFYFHSLMRVLDLQGRLDEEATRFCQVELTNGSCILVRTEDVQAS